jgi:putative transposase
MMPLTEAEQTCLEHLRNRGTTQQRLALRANILLTLAQGLPVLTNAKQLKLTPKTVRKWRHRWLEAADRLKAASSQADPGLRPVIQEVLGDAPRPGKPAEFTPEQITQIVALACEDPTESGRPLTHWTQRELADEAIKRGFVKTISHRSVGRFLKRGRSETPPVEVLAQPRAREGPGDVR